jgi:error-prone DNA polymerase
MAAWKRHGRLERHRVRLLQGFAERGISATFAEQIYQQVQGFGEYGFPESHAASFALLVYVSSWQKVFHPAAFTCALLNAQPMGFYSPSSLVRDAQAHGVTVRPVCVLASDWDNLLEYDEASGARTLPEGGRRGELDEQPAIRLGMRQVKGMPEVAAQAIVAARREAPFRSLADLVQRTGLKKNEVEALAEAGALAALVPERREALWRARAPRAPGLFEGLPMEGDRDVGLPALGRVEQLILDYGRTGMSIEDHPMNHIRPRITGARAGRAGRERVHTARDLLHTKDGKNVVVAGLVIGRQRPATASGVTFITLEDETGVINLVVHKRIFTEQYLVARHAKIVLVRGRVEREGEVIHVLVRKMERLDLPGDEPLAARSRDFH